MTWASPYLILRGRQTIVWRLYLEVNEQTSATNQPRTPSLSDVLTIFGTAVIVKV
jgi:hypothetical protein